MHFRIAREMWEPTRMPTNYQKFLKRAHEDANDAQVEALLKHATREDLCDMVRDLRQRLRVAERAMSSRVLIGND